MGLRTPMTSGSSQIPGIIPAAVMWSTTARKPPSGNRTVDGSHCPALSHQSPSSSSYHPASMQKYSAPAAAAGAEDFCIDAGWYDDELGDWWDSAGQWLPSTVRFPDGGLRAVVDHITAAGMIPGIWLEPEVIGVRSPMVDQLPDSAFLMRDGVRVS